VAYGRAAIYAPSSDSRNGKLIIRVSEGVGVHHRYGLTKSDVDDVQQTLLMQGKTKDMQVLTRRTRPARFCSSDKHDRKDEIHPFIFLRAIVR
jgi:hypothetical protein